MCVCVCDVCDVCAVVEEEEHLRVCLRVCAMCVCSLLTIEIYAPWLLFHHVYTSHCRALYTAPFAAMSHGETRAHDSNSDGLESFGILLI